MQKKISFDNIKVIVVVIEILIYIAFSFAYVNIAEVFAYRGYGFEFEYTRFIISTFILLVSCFTGFLIKNTFNYTIWHIYFIYMLIPALIDYYSSANSFHLITIILIFLLILIITFKIKIKIKFSKLSIKDDQNYYFLILLSIILFIPFLIYYFQFININNLLLNDIYTTRYVFRNESIRILSYIMNFMVKIILPVLVVASLQRKNFKLSILFIIMILYLFLCGAFKSYLMGVFVVLIFYLGDYSKKLLLFAFGILCVALAGFLHDNFFIFWDYGVRRVFFTPVGLSHIYIEYFKDFPLYWSHTPIGSIFKNYPFDMGLTGYVGTQVVGREGLNANIGVIIEGFVSAGYYGIIIHSFLLGFLFSFIRNLNISPRYFGIIVIIIFNTMNSLLFVLLATHGLIVFLIVAMFFLKNSNEYEKLTY